MEKNTPHGGKLINRVDLLLSADLSRSCIELDTLELSDLELIANGGYSPLQGFMGKADYDCVVQNMRLANGLPWSLPITLAVEKEKAERIKKGETVNLAYDGTIYGVMNVEEIFFPDKKLEAEKVYQTADLNHPGVRKLFARPEMYVAGPITLVKRPEKSKFSRYYLDPIDTRKNLMNWAGKPLLASKRVTRCIEPMNTFKKQHSKR